MAVRSTAPLLHLFFASSTPLIPHSRYSLFNNSLPPHFPSLSSPPCSVARVTTTPVEIAPPAPEFDFEEEIARLKAIRSRLGSCGSLRRKLKVVGDDSRVKRFFDTHRHGFARVLASLNLDSYELFLIKCLVAAGQEHVLASGFELEASELESARSSMKSAFYALVEMIEGCDGAGKVVEKKSHACLKDEEIGDLRRMLKTLREIEEFYNCIGGIIGYQITVLELLPQSSSERQTSHNTHELMESQFLEIHAPSGFDLSQNAEYASQAALWGIEGLPGLGEIYPLGGSADRLGLVDPDTGECLPAAMLPYCGRTLLEGLIRDLQPLVPTVSAEDGEWVVAKPFSPVCRPGGHGVLWMLAYDKGIFQWFYSHGRKGATVRQVSNVVAATDLTLLALAGIGLHHGKTKLGGHRRN